MSKSERYVFFGKKEFYEKKHNRKVDRAIVISPMIDPKAQKAAYSLGIETYSFADDVKI